jgi:hypothetical protein
MAGKTETSCDCGTALPMALVVPYDAEWDYGGDLLHALMRHSGHRLMGRYVGTEPERVALLNHAEYLYLSRYPRFTFALLESFSALAVLELDLSSIRSLEGIGALLSLRSFTATECKKLEVVDGLAELRDLTVLDLSLCNKISDLSPAASCTRLKWLRFDGKELRDLEFTSGMASLETVVLNCSVMSRDLTPLEGKGVRRLVVRQRAFTKPMIERFCSRTPNFRVEYV